MDSLMLFEQEVDSIRARGLYKTERLLQSPQAVRIRVGGKEVLNFCANNYLGLSNNRVLLRAAKKGLDEFGLGLSSVRFICGTQTIHKELEKKISAFLHTEETILYTSCFDANAGLFETLLSSEDAVISDRLNHASIIDGIRLCKACRYTYEHGDMGDLEAKLIEARTKGLNKIIIATDGVFSMDGEVARLGEICRLATRHQALMMVDDSHATGFFGASGRGSIEHCELLGRVDIITSTLGKAMGGATGGFTSGKRQIIELLRQRSRPYLFSNSLPPALVASAIACIDLLSESTRLRDKLAKNTRYFRKQMARLGFDIPQGVHPIVPIMLYDARLASAMADALLQEGIYVIGFSYPVVPQGQARIRVQLSAAHTRGELNQAISAFEKVGRLHSVIR
ncbi:MAG: glycine C-acetyltransferase [Deltaproteobacteria bacterium]|nr:glycine C-acetyltransferase [Deltaproteobacteria bacterium]